MPYSDGWKLVCQQQLCWLKLTQAQRLLNGRLISVLAKREKLENIRTYKVTVGVSRLAKGEQNRLKLKVMLHGTIRNDHF